MKIEERDWAASTLVRQHGSSRVFVECPFCQATLTVYLWSFAGHGKKRCACGAALYRNGIARKESK